MDEALPPCCWELAQGGLGAAAQTGRGCSELCLLEGLRTTSGTYWEQDNTNEGQLLIPEMPLGTAKEKQD